MDHDSYELFQDALRDISVMRKYFPVSPGGDELPLDEFSGGKLTNISFPSLVLQGTIVNGDRDRIEAARLTDPPFGCNHKKTLQERHRTVLVKPKEGAV